MWDRTEGLPLDNGKALLIAKVSDWCSADTRPHKVPVPPPNLPSEIRSEGWSFPPRRDTRDAPKGIALEPCPTDASYSRTAFAALWPWRCRGPSDITWPGHQGFQPRPEVPPGCRQSVRGAQPRERPPRSCYLKRASAVSASYSLGHRPRARLTRHLTPQITDPAPVDFRLQLERHRRVRCICLVGIISS